MPMQCEFSYSMSWTNNIAKHFHLFIKFNLMLVTQKWQFDVNVVNYWISNEISYSGLCCPQIMELLASCKAGDATTIHQI